MDVRVHVRPTVREPDGLAMSSRNAYLDEAQRAYAPSLYAALQLGKTSIESGERSAAAVTARVRERLSGPHARIDYVEVVDAATLRPVETITGEILLAAAVYVGPARLIDNVTVNVQRRAPVRTNE
jgi:pantoate--beta-alanine ligase